MTVVRCRGAFAALLFGLILPGCGTYYDPADNYVRGVRWFDRGQYKAAEDTWKPLADAGDCDAQARLGHLLYAGAKPGAEQEAAARMLRTAAERGQPFAQFWYGTIHYDGQIYTRQMEIQTKCDGCGVERNPELAYMWFELSRRNAVYESQTRNAETALEQIRHKMTADQVAAGDRRVAAWQPTGPLCQPRKLL